MKQLALVGLEDGDVDVLSRIRRRDDLALAAVYHPDPSALIMRLAGPARVPTLSDPGALCDLAVETWIGGGAAADILNEARDRARANGRRAPIVIPVAEIDLFLSDPDRYNSEVNEGGSPSPAPLNPQDPDTRGEEPTTVTRKDVPAAKSDAQPTTAPRYASSEPDGAAVAQAEAARPAPDDADDDSPASSNGSSLGNPSIEMLYDPSRLGAWLTAAAARVAGGSAAVLWRRESDGKRYTPAACAPNADAVPGITFPALQLEEYVRAGRVQAIPPDQFVPPGAAPLPFRFLAVPLPGEKQAGGLLGVFRPVAAGEFPRGGVAELSARAAELGIAIERCFQFARMNQELRGLRFKERLRDLMLEGGLAESDRWSRLLRFLLDEVAADFAQFYALADAGRRLSLGAVVSRDEEFEGIVSIPVGRGVIGSALERERLSVYTADDDDPRGLYVLPVRARGANGPAPVGVIVLDGAPDRAGDGQETAGLLEMTGSIIAPLIGNVLPPARP